MCAMVLCGGGIEKGYWEEGAGRELTRVDVASTEVAGSRGRQGQGCLGFGFRSKVTVG
jgi:hypothetical protein